jgi:hypothetical protein
VAAFVASSRWSATPATARSITSTTRHRPRGAAPSPRGCKGKRLPLIDRVEISPIEEAQPRWLSFLNGEHDFIERVPPEFVNVALPGGQVAPNLARQGIQL